MIYVECTTTYYSSTNTGIQRVVRNLLRHLPSVAAEQQFDVKPLILHEGDFVVAPPDNVFLDKSLNHKSSVARLLEFVFALWSSRIDRDGQFDSLQVNPGDLLLLLDSSWYKELWPAVKKFKANQGRVMGVIYDLVPITHPETTAEGVTAAFEMWLQNYLQVTDHTITISQSTKIALENYLQTLSASGKALPSQQISYFHLGAELDFASPEVHPREKFCELFHGESPIFLVVGSIEPRKNYGFVLDAFERLWAQGSHARLVIIGKEGWKNRTFISRVDRHTQKNRQLFLIRDASDVELDFAYRNSSALILASLIEGFGLPIVEAHRRGLPVLCSNIPVFREVAGDRAIYFEIDDPENLVRAINRFLENKSNSARELLPWITWRESARQLLEIIYKHSNAI